MSGYVAVCRHRRDVLGRWVSFQCVSFGLGTDYLGCVAYIRNYLGGARLTDMYWKLCTFYSLNDLNELYTTSYACTTGASHVLLDVLLLEPATSHTLVRILWVRASNLL